MCVCVFSWSMVCCFILVQQQHKTQHRPYCQQVMPVIQPGLPKSCHPINSIEQSTAQPKSLITAFWHTWCCNTHPVWWINVIYDAYMDRWRIKYVNSKHRWQVPEEARKQWVKKTKSCTWEMPPTTIWKDSKQNTFSVDHPQSFTKDTSWWLEK